MGVFIGICDDVYELAIPTRIERVLYVFLIMLNCIAY